jgi:hypothetical protein
VSENCVQKVMLCKDSRQWFCVEMVSAVMLCGDGVCSNVDRRW